MDEVSNTADFLVRKVDEIVEDAALFGCDFFDAEIVHKITQDVLFGLATACIDNTTGNVFSGPASVAVDIRKEMVDYLTQWSERFVAEYILHESQPVEASDNPHEIISEFIDEFGSSKRNLFSRVSAWLLSENREEKIDDFVQEMDIEGFWPIDRREAFARILLKNIDIKNKFHCNMKFSSPAELADHQRLCSFRSLTCRNEGCNASFPAGQSDSHDLVCPFKIIPCEQKCSDNIMRRDMDKHCITVCPMKLINCPFNAVGCQSTIALCMLHQHCLDVLPSHLLHVLQIDHKGTSITSLESRVEELMLVCSPSRLAQSHDVRSLISAIKPLEVELGPLEIVPPADVDEDSVNVPIEASSFSEGSKK